jgi:hypothetical protein
VFCSPLYSKDDATNKLLWIIHKTNMIVFEMHQKQTETSLQNVKKIKANNQQFTFLVVMQLVHEFAAIPLLKMF